jgi:probable HAF family extracellular repeat protein
MKRIGVLFFLNLFAGSFPAFGANYTITDLDTLGGAASHALALNESGQVVGVSRTISGSDHAFLWQTNRMTDLGTLGGTNSSASGINQSGQIVGWAESADGRVRACLFGSETNVDLSGDLSQNSYAAAINNEGDIVGWSDSGATGQSFHAFLFRPTVRDLGGLQSRALAVNDEGAVVGWIRDPFWTWVPQDVAVYWPGAKQTSSNVRLGAGSNSHAYAVNSAGQSAGAGPTDYFPTRAMLWIRGGQIHLGALAGTWSSANGLNDKSEVVGSSDAYRFGQYTNVAISLSGLEGTNRIGTGYVLTRHAFLWRNGALLDLNELVATNSGWELNDATAINNAGQIVGNGKFNGEQRAFLLTPNDNPSRLPFVRLYSPNNSDLIQGSRVTLRAEAIPGSNPIAQVEFYLRRVVRINAFNNSITVVPLLTDSKNPPEFVGSATNAPYQLALDNLAPGNYSVTARVVDVNGISVRSEEGLLRMNGSPSLHLFSTVISDGGGLSQHSFTLIGNEEITYDIEASDYLADWSKTGTISPGSQSINLQILTADMDKHSHRFYRAVAR